MVAFMVFGQVCITFEIGKMLRIVGRDPAETQWERQSSWGFSASLGARKKNPFRLNILM